MSKIDALRKIIREEVIRAIRQEIPKILSEAKTDRKGISNVINEMKKQSFPVSLNTVDTYSKPVKFDTHNPLASLLNETANDMSADDIDTISYTTDNINPASFFQPKEASVGNIDSMITSARPSSDVSMVQINEVPDYSNLMKKMMDKGIM